MQWIKNEMEYTHYTQHACTPETVNCEWIAISCRVLLLSSLHGTAEFQKSQTIIIIIVLFSVYAWWLGEMKGEKEMQWVFYVKEKIQWFKPPKRVSRLSEMKKEPIEQCKAVSRILDEVTAFWKESWKAESSSTLNIDCILEWKYSFHFAEKVNDYPDSQWFFDDTWCSSGRPERTDLLQFNSNLKILQIQNSDKSDKFSRFGILHLFGVWTISISIWYVNSIEFGSTLKYRVKWFQSCCPLLNGQ